MTNLPNPNRRRRLTADELIAVGVALAGIGTIFFWGIGQQYQPMFQRGIASLGSDNANRQNGLFDDGTATNGQQKRAISSITRDRQNSAPTTTILVPPIVRTTEVPFQTNTTPVAPIAAPAIVPVPTTTKPAFTDVPNQLWAATYITELRQRGILDDFGTDKFAPSKKITRGEYAKVLDRAFADKQATAVPVEFTDIPTNYPRKEAVAKSVQRGFMTGYSPTKFAPNQSIPRYQMQISLAKGLELPPALITEKVLSKYGDAKQLPKYARNKMAAAVESGLVINDDKTANLLKPVQNATRADAAALIYQALVKEGKMKPQQ